MNGADVSILAVINLHFTVSDVHIAFAVNSQTELAGFGEVTEVRQSAVGGHVSDNGTPIIFIDKVERFAGEGLQEGGTAGDVIHARDDGLSVRGHKAGLRDVQGISVEIVEIAPSVRRLQSLGHILHRTHRPFFQRLQGFLRIIGIDRINQHGVPGVSPSAE